MGMIKEFREFALKGNVVDMAVGVIIGTAFGAIVKSLVDHIMMPPIGYVTGGVDFKDKKLVLLEKTDASPGVTIQWGEFTNTIIQFVIIALCLFFVIKLMNMAKQRFEEKKAEAVAEQTATEKLLTDIRDELRARPRM
jgi:large conductance mechanosensitive channel